VIYNITLGGKLSVLWNFKGYFSSDGAEPAGVLVQGNDGNFHGTTLYDGASAKCSGGCGAVIKITPSGVLNVLHSFTGFPDGARHRPDTRNRWQFLRGNFGRRKE
jgi:uncharacterized repeat protein (TIGR03803 family)